MPALNRSRSPLPSSELSLLPGESAPRGDAQQHIVIWWGERGENGSGFGQGWVGGDGEGTGGAGLEPTGGLPIKNDGERRAGGAVSRGVPKGSLTITSMHVGCG